MPVFSLQPGSAFPDPAQAEPDGLLAVGGDLSPDRLLAAYRAGIFPWYGPRAPILWWAPPERALVLPGAEHLSRSTVKALSKLNFQIRRDTCFEQVIGHCARLKRAAQAGTWITRDMRQAYLDLHGAGFAHSFEAFRNDRLVGGLYGISLGAAFFGESMFSLESYASRAAFAALCRQAWAWGFHFIDGQVPNENLLALGARVIPRAEFQQRLAKALEPADRRGSWTD